MRQAVGLLLTFKLKKRRIQILDYNGLQIQEYQTSTMYSGTPLIQSPAGRENLAVLTGWSH